jgi:uncharacterized protein YdcH (DUF465 family)
MSEFDDLRQQLAEGRAKRDSAGQTASQAQEQLSRLKREKAQFERVFDAQNEGHRARMARLEEQIKRAEAVVARRRQGYAEVSDVVAGLYKQFEPFTDPREMIGQFKDSYPILLLPLRIETRFKLASAVPGAVGRVSQLWVRVYPDECAVDRFEPVLSESEIHSAQLFWAEMWAAGGVEDLERSAWRGLVASHGAGRAAWIARAYVPENAAEIPTKAQPTDIILVVASEETLSATDKAAASDYWKAIWLADGDESASEVAWQALKNAVGAERADALATRFQPTNLTTVPAPPLTKDDVAVSVAFLDFPAPEKVDSKERSWSQSPKVNILPERLVLIGYQGDQVAFEVVGNPIPSPLVAGPDPSAPDSEQLRPENGDLIIPDDIQWMVDFQRAVDVGMGFKVNLTPTQARRGFDRLLVLGVRLSADEQGGKQLVETLFEHHHFSRTGISLLPQGTPTNNTEQGGAGFSRSEDAGATFDDYLKSDVLYTPETDPMLRRDGQWLADYLGLDPAVIQKISGSGGTDQLEARAMNIALWNGTLGYMMDTMMAPLFGPDDIRFTRAFYTNFVSGRGPLPVLRIGAQPYGILPTTVFSQMRWLLRRTDNDAVLTHATVSSSASYLAQLYAVLRRMDTHWASLANDVAHVDQPSDDPHQILLDILGLHPASVEYHQRYAESFDHLYNMMNVYGAGGSFLAALIAGAYVKSGMDLLAEFGYTGDATPDILERLFLSSQHLMQGPVIDDVPLSETDPIHAYTDDERNYVQWLIDAARTSLETLRRQDGFTDDKSPAALFYIVARYALMQSYWITSIRLHELAGVFSANQVQAVRHEPAFIHVQEQVESSESRFTYLYKTSPQITGSDNVLVADHITNILPQTTGTQAIATADLREQVAALERLRDVPTARLERLFAEHIDTVAYRLDAWELGLLNYQLMLMRYQRQGDNEEDNVRRGLYVGAFGWVEELKPEGKKLTPVTLEPELDKVFNTDPAAPPLMRDPTNGGYIHAPSLNHAVTAAILRNGYLANATPSNPDSLAVNLSSDRARRAVSAIEGIRAGQSLGALLGYQFERGLHDRHNLAEVDEFIYDLRKAFPLRAKQLKSTLPPDDTSIEAIEARNVLDGLKLVEHIRATNNATYPFGKTLPPATPAQAAAINAEVDRMLDTHDAVADVAIAEAVHHAAQGNYDRAAGTLDTYTKGNFPPIPDVIQTPRSGIALTHRVGLQLQTGLNPATSPIPGMVVTPRSQAEPALNTWLASVLPHPADVFCTVTITDPVDATETSVTVSQQDVGLQPIDLLYILTNELQPAMAEIDDRVMRHVVQTQAPRADASIRIEYTRKAADLTQYTFFELMPLVASLRKLVLSSRPLLPSDVRLPLEAQAAQDETVSLDRLRVSTAHATVTALRNDMATFQAALEPLLDDLDTHRGDILSGIDTFSDQLIGLLERASRSGIPQTGWGFIYQRRAALYTRLLDAIAALVDRWTDRLASFDAAMLDYDNLPVATPDAERFDLLIAAERWVSTQAENPLPATPAAMRTLLATKRTAFADRLDQFDALLSGSQSLSGLVVSLQALLPIDAFDLDPFPITALEDEIILFADDMAGLATGLGADLDKRLSAAQAQLDAHDAAATPSERVAALQAGAKALFGADFVLIPEFTLNPDQGLEWEKAFAASGDLLDYQTNTLKVDFPVDDWLYGAARVREKLRHWERVLMLAEGFETTAPLLTPVQFPYLDQDSWLALEFPEDYQIDTSRLLYTAHYATPFNRNAPQCGLLVDEWTEVIPGTEETTGITFHYDRPNAEPPQVMLLATPPQFVGSWRWQDLVDTLHETLAMAKKRAVEPAQVDKTAFARFLPATVMAHTVYGLSIAANYAVNNGVYAVLAGDDNA